MTMWEVRKRGGERERKQLLEVRARLSEICEMFDAEAGVRQVYIGKQEMQAAMGQVIYT